MIRFMLVKLVIGTSNKDERIKYIRHQRKLTDTESTSIHTRNIPMSRVLYPA